MEPFTNVTPHLHVDSNDIEKEYYFNPLLIRSNKKGVFPFDDFDSEPYCNAHLVRRMGANCSQAHVEDELGENGRKIRTPQVNPESQFQFPFNAKAPREDLETRSRVRLGKRKKSTNVFGSSGNMSELQLHINRVVIRQKPVQRRKLPMIIQKKELKVSTKEDSRENPKATLPAEAKPQCDMKEEVKGKTLKSTLGKPRPVWGAPLRKGKVTSNELRFQYDKSNRLALQEKLMVNASMSLESHKPKSIVSSNSSAAQSKNDQTLPLLTSSNESSGKEDDVVSPKIKKCAKKAVIPAKPVKMPEEPVINPRPRPVFATPDFYLVSLPQQL